MPSMGVDWKMFAGGPNTPENVARKGAVLGVYMTAVAAGWTRTLVAQAAQKVVVPPLAPEAALIETVVFFVHFADRVAFEVLGPSLRGPFMEGLEASVWDELARAAEDDESRDEQLRAFDSLLPSREQEYSGYRTATDAGAGMAGDLFWEFSRRFLRAIDPKDRAPELVFVAVPSVMAELQAVGIDAPPGGRMIRGQALRRPIV